jgi:rubrerythrin
MSETKTEEVLKSAILLEARGKAFYENVSEQTRNSAVKAFFKLMAQEEGKHMEVLWEQFRAYRSDHAFLPKDYTQQNENDNIAAAVLTPEVMNQIGSAGYEAAAISAAMNMEKQAIALYSERAKTATDPREKAMYDWLARWETRHSRFLSDLDRALTEKVWNDNQFWPF